MATENSTSTGSLAEEERFELAREASCEIASCANAILALNQKVETYSVEQRAVRALLLRIDRMAGVIISAATDVQDESGVRELRSDANLPAEETSHG